MGDLVNELTWSFSRYGCFKECRRKYYWNYYHKWNGWNPDAPEDVRKAYLLSKMTTADLYVGTVSHSIIAWIIQRIRAKTPVHFENLKEQADGMLRAGITSSREKQWLLNPKAVNFMEDYYGKGISEDKEQDIINKTQTAVSNFLKSSTYQNLSNPRVKVKWLAVDNDRSFSSFDLDGIKVFAEPDLAIQIGDKCYLFDWKTGKQSQDHDQQLIAYALYACSEFSFTPENIVARAVYLHALDPSTNHPIEHPVRYDEEEAGYVREHIKNTFSEMRSLVSPDNTADIANFPKCDRPGLCKRCQFQELCG
jgi:CRISPR/Cas system-associated exonuclease Cas4 (RecB family)